MDMAPNFYQQNKMHTKLPPQDAGRHATRKIARSPVDRTQWRPTPCSVQCIMFSNPNVSGFRQNLARASAPSRAFLVHHVSRFKVTVDVQVVARRARSSCLGSCRAHRSLKVLLIDKRSRRSGVSTAEPIVTVHD